MIAFGYYLLKVILCSGILYGYYWLALRNRIFHQWNRYYLLAVLVISIMLPLVKIPVQVDPVQSQADAVKVLNIVTSGDAYVESLDTAVTGKPAWESLLAVAYGLVCLVFLGGLANGLLAIRRLVLQNPVYLFDRFLLVDTAEEKAPFSFLHYVFWHRKIPIDSDTGQQILRHEIAHVREQHTVDKVFMQFVLSIFWMNPLFWLIRKEMGIIHEFIADRQSVAEGDTAAFAAMILQSAYPGRSFGLSNPFFHSPIQRRLHMLRKARNAKVSYATRILALPLLGMIGVAFTVKTIHKDVDPLWVAQSLTQSSQLSIDAATIKPGTKTALQNETLQAVRIDNLPVESITNQQDKEDTSILRMGKSTLTLSSSAPWDMPQRLIIINGRKTNIHAILQKKIEADSIIVYPKNNEEAIRKFGPEASQGVFCFYGATVTDAPPSAEVKTEIEIYGNIAPVQNVISPEISLQEPKPLYVIDEMIISRKAEREVLNLVKPEDIEKIDVLKGKSAIAIYGEDGKNGAVVITTKRARERGANEGGSKPILETFEVKDNTPVFSKVEIPARFPGGQSGMENWLRDQLDRQVSIRENPEGFRGKAGLRFIVNSVGQVTDVSLLDDKSISYNSKLGLIVSALLEKGPYWEPAKQNGNKVRSFVDIEFVY